MNKWDSDDTLALVAIVTICLIGVLFFGSFALYMLGVRL